MKKTSLRLAKPAKLKTFAQVSTRWVPIADALKHDPGVWYRIKGATLNDVVALRTATPIALRGNRFEVKVRHQRRPDIKVWARYTGSAE